MRDLEPSGLAVEYTPTDTGKCGTYWWSFDIRVLNGWGRAEGGLGGWEGGGGGVEEGGGTNVCFELEITSYGVVR